MTPRARILATTVMLFIGFNSQARAKAVTTLDPCPKSPNCVSSQATDRGHAIDPLRFSGDADSAWKTLKGILGGLERTAIVEESSTYLHVVSTSRIFRFVDDVEFVLEAAAGEIQVRSASRSGYSDMGVNRRRVEEIRREMERAVAVR